MKLDGGGHPKPNRLVLFMRRSCQNTLPPPISVVFYDGRIGLHTRLNRCWFSIVTSTRVPENNTSNLRRGILLIILLLNNDKRSYTVAIWCWVSKNDFQTRNSLSLNFFHGSRGNNFNRIFRSHIDLRVELDDPAFSIPIFFIDFIIPECVGFH